MYMHGFLPHRPFLQVFQVTRSCPSPSFDRSYLKGQICPYEHKIVVYARNMLKSLSQVKRKNIWVCIWL